jgi:hypothetical protein
MDGFVALEPNGLVESTDSANRLTAAEQREFESRMQKKQMKEFMGVS